MALIYLIGDSTNPHSSLPAESLSHLRGLPCLGPGSGHLKREFLRGCSASSIQTLSSILPGKAYFSTTNFRKKKSHLKSLLLVPEDQEFHSPVSKLNFFQWGARLIAQQVGRAFALLWPGFEPRPPLSYGPESARTNF